MSQYQTLSSLFEGLTWDTEDTAETMKNLILNRIEQRSSEYYDLSDWFRHMDTEDLVIGEKDFRQLMAVGHIAGESYWSDVRYLKHTYSQLRSKLPGNFTGISIDATTTAAGMSELRSRVMHVCRSLASKPSTTKVSLLGQSLLGRNTHHWTGDRPLSDGELELMWEEHLDVFRRALVLRWEVIKSVRAERFRTRLQTLIDSLISVGVGDLQHDHAQSISDDVREHSELLQRMVFALRERHITISSSGAHTQTTMCRKAARYSRALKLPFAPVSSCKKILDTIADLHQSVLFTIVANEGDMSLLQNEDCSPPPRMTPSCSVAEEMSEGTMETSEFESEGLSSRNGSERCSS